MADGSTLVFTEVYETYHPRVVAYAARLVGASEAEDVAQEVFFRVSRSLHTLADRSRVLPWIFTITLNTVRDLARRRLSHDVPRASSSDESSEPGEQLANIPDSRARTPEEAAVRAEMIACYFKYMKRLPRGQYEVYVLSEFAGLSNPQIAQRLTLPLSTVKIRLHRARTGLHANLRRNCQCYYNERGELMGEPIVRLSPARRTPR